MDKKNQSAQEKHAKYTNKGKKIKSDIWLTILFQAENQISTKGNENITAIRQCWLCDGGFEIRWQLK